MALYFEIVYGLDRGSQFPVRPGLKVGRKRADVLLRDQKISGIHAIVEQGAKGELILKDNDSANGMRVDGKKVKQVVLAPGVIVQIGDTYLRVGGDSAAEAPSKSTGPVTAKTWRENLAGWFLEQADKISARESKSNVRSFQQTVELEMVAGPQLGTIWKLGYGPRRIGRNSIEFPIWEARAPGLCFKLEAGENGECIFSTGESETVRLNGGAVANQTLAAGDEISFFTYVIKVRFYGPQANRNI